MLRYEYADSTMSRSRPGVNGAKVNELRSVSMNSSRSSSSLESASLSASRTGSGHRSSLLSKGRGSWASAVVLMPAVRQRVKVQSPRGGLAGRCRWAVIGVSFPRTSQPDRQGQDRPAPLGLGELEVEEGLNQGE